MTMPISSQGTVAGASSGRSITSCRCATNSRVPPVEISIIFLIMGRTHAADRIDGDLRHCPISKAPRPERYFWLGRIGPGHRFVEHAAGLIDFADDDVLGTAI